MAIDSTQNNQPVNQQPQQVAPPPPPPPPPPDSYTPPVTTAQNTQPQPRDVLGSNNPGNTRVVPADTQSSLNNALSQPGGTVHPEIQSFLQNNPGTQANTQARTDLTTQTTTVPQAMIAPEITPPHLSTLPITTTLPGATATQPLATALPVETTLPVATAAPYTPPEPAVATQPPTGDLVNDLVKYVNADANNQQNLQTDLEQWGEKDLGLSQQSAQAIAPVLAQIAPALVKAIEQAKANGSLSSGTGSQNNASPISSGTNTPPAGGGISSSASPQTSTGSGGGGANSAGSSPAGTGGGGGAGGASGSSAANKSGGGGSAGGANAAGSSPTLSNGSPHAESTGGGLGGLLNLDWLGLSTNSSMHTGAGHAKKPTNTGNKLQDLSNIVSNDAGDQKQLQTDLGNWLQNDLGMSAAQAAQLAPTLAQAATSLAGLLDALAAAGIDLGGTTGSSGSSGTTGQGGVKGAVGAADLSSRLVASGTLPGAGAASSKSTGTARGTNSLGSTQASKASSSADARSTIQGDEEGEDGEALPGNISGFVSRVTRRSKSSDSSR